MNPVNNQKIRPVQNSNYQHKPSEVVYQVQEGPITVAPGETVEILIPGPRGFSVFFPIGGHFNAQVFEAVENPAWAMEEMEAAAGGSMESSEDKVWGVQMTRISKAGPHPIRDFPYCIFSKELNNFAVGKNSPPTMNLDP